MDATVGRLRGAFVAPPRLLSIPPHTVERVVVGVTVVLVLAIGAWTLVGVALIDESLLTLIPLAGSVLVSGAAVWLAGRRPALAEVVATLPFLWMLVDHRWLGVWLVAQLVVVSLAAARSWRLAAVPVLGGVV